jgi:hypothetical protein
MAKDKPKLARTLRFICDYALGAAFLWTVIFLFWILWILIAPTVLGRPAQIPHISIRVGVGIGSPAISLPVKMHPNDILASPDAGLFNTSGELRFQTNKRRIQFLSLLDNIVFSLLILGLAYIVRQFLVDVIDGNVFSLENARRLKWIGWLLLVIALFKPIYDFITARWVFSIVRVQNPVLSPPIEPDIVLILVSLFILILSAAFRYGVVLEKEHSLTV